MTIDSKANLDRLLLYQNIHLSNFDKTNKNELSDHDKTNINTRPCSIPTKQQLNQNDQQ